MDTMTTDKKRVRRNHSVALKAQVLAECQVRGASVAKVAMAHGINANVVHAWRRLGREQLTRVVTPSFMPLAIEDPAMAASTERHIDIELRRGALSLRMAWPLSAAAELSAWMRELLR
jgi:transposase